MKLGDWLEERAGWRGVVKKALDEPVPGGASMAYVLGSVLVFLLLLQFTTGVLLALYYSPSSTDAWASVAYLEDQVTLGWLVRGLHHHGASAMVIVSGLHLLQVAVWGAYRRPRELNWLVGVLLLGLLLAFALTGYLLPWDQTGYWATKVATGIAGETPLLGRQLQEAAQAGNEYGNLTLTRFYALHVLVLPAATLGLLVVHLALFRKHGVTPSWRRSDAELRAREQPFWPDQLFRDVVAMAAAFAALLAWTVHTGGAGLDAPADPSSNFDARPEWYFRPLFQLLKYFEGTAQVVAALGAPALAGAVLLGLPLLDRAASRAPSRRLLPLGVLASGIIAAGVLTALSYRQDAADDQLAERQAAADRDAARARALAKAHGVPSAGGVAVYATAPFAVARAVWARECASCHEGADNKGPRIGPGYNDRAWLRGFLLDPSGEAYFGNTRLGTGEMAMPKVEASPADLEALVEAMYAEARPPDVDEALAARGRELFSGDAGCSDCHARTPLPAPGPVAVVAPPPVDAAPAGGAAPSAAGAAEGGSEAGGDGDADAEVAEAGEAAEAEDAPTGGPDLGDRGSPAWLAAMIRDATVPRMYGVHNEMPAFVEELSPGEIRALVEWLTWLRTATEQDVAALDR